MTAQTESQRAELVIHNHKRARGEVHTWHVERAGEVLLRDTTRRSPLAGISKRRQVAGAFGRLVVQTPVAAAPATAFWIIQAMYCGGSK